MASGLIKTTKKRLTVSSAAPTQWRIWLTCHIGIRDAKISGLVLQ